MINITKVKADCVVQQYIKQGLQSQVLYCIHWWFYNEAKAAILYALVWVQELDLTKSVNCEQGRP